MSWMARSDTRILLRRVDVAPKAEELGRAAPPGREGVVAAVAEVEGDRHGGLDEPGPDRVVRRVAERTGRAVLAGHRRRPDVHDPGARRSSSGRARRGRPPGRPATASGRRGSGPRGRSPSPRRASVLNAVRLAMVASTSSFSASSTPHPSVGNSTTAPELLVGHDLQPRVAVLVLGAERLDLHERARVDALGDLAPEQRVDAARHDDRVEGRVRDEAVGVAADQQPGAPAVLRRPARPGARRPGSRCRVKASSGS